MEFRSLFFLRFLPSPEGDRKLEEVTQILFPHFTLGVNKIPWARHSQQIYHGKQTLSKSAEWLGELLIQEADFVTQTWAFRADFHAPTWLNSHQIGFYRTLGYRVTREGIPLFNKKWLEKQSQLRSSRSLLNDIKFSRDRIHLSSIVCVYTSGPIINLDNTIISFSLPHLGEN